MSNPNKKNGPAPRGAAVLVIVILALVFALVIFGLGQLNPTGIADLLASLFSRGTEDEQNEIDPGYAALLEQLADASPPQPMPVDSLTLTEAFAHFPFATHYEHLYTVSYADGSRSFARTVSLTRSGDDYQISQYEGDHLNPKGILWSAVSEGDTFTVQDSIGNRHEYARGDDFPFSSVALLPDPDLFCAQLLAFEQNPDASPLSACSAQIVHENDMRLLVLSFTQREDGGTEEYRYLLDYGILYSATGTRDGRVYYTLDTVAFNLSQSTNAHTAGK